MADKGANPMWLGDCPRCGVKLVTFDIQASVYADPTRADEYGFEVFARCRSCGLPSVILIEKQYSNASDPMAFGGEFLNAIYEFKKNVVTIGTRESCPEFVPPDLERIFDEAATCLAMGCYDASGAMFRKVVDMATKRLLPDQPDPEDQQDPDYIAWKVRKDLKLRLEWLFRNGKLAPALEPLLENVREDGNDAAHDVIGRAEAEDLQDFVVVLLETLYTVPGQVELNRQRRLERRANS